jgi:hypothetical protein
VAEEARRFVAEKARGRPRKDGLGRAAGRADHDGAKLELESEDEAEIEMPRQDGDEGSGREDGAEGERDVDLPFDFNQLESGDVVCDLLRRWTRDEAGENDLDI